MKLTSLFVAIATLGPIGYGVASGTLATVCTIPLVWILHHYAPSFQAQAVTIFVIILIGLYCIRRALDAFERGDDPSEIVLDEVIGCLITFYMIPLTVLSVCIGIVLFRLFDIFKPLGIARLEFIGGASGVLLDDMVAGIMANSILHVIYWALA